MKYLVLICALLATSAVSLGQNVYQIRADSVRIYNVCDTAELILENRTQGVSGFLYNKGRGRTEFRKVRLEKIGNSQIAITGQDTLDLSSLPGISGVDTIYRSGDNIAYRKRGLLYTIPVPAGSSADYIQNQTNAAQTNSNGWVSGFLTGATLRATAAPGIGDLQLYNGNITSAGLRWVLFKNLTEGAGDTGNDLVIKNYSNSGVNLGAPFQIKRSTGWVTMANGFNGANTSGIIGSNTTTPTNTAIFEFNLADAVTRNGYVGTIAGDAYLTSENNNVHLRAGAANSSQFIMSPTSLKLSTGLFSLTNGTSNIINFALAGLGAPTFNTSSLGTKIILWDGVSPTTTDWAIGMEGTAIWMGIPNALASAGFKWYGSTTLVSRLDGIGNQEWLGSGRFKGRPSPTSPGTAPAVELGFASGTGIIQSVDPNGNLYLPTRVIGGSGTASPNFSTLIVDSTGFQFYDYGYGGAKAQIHPSTNLNTVSINASNGSTLIPMLLNAALIKIQAPMTVTGTATVTGSVSQSGSIKSLRVITGSYTATPDDYTLINRTTSGAPVLTLPTASANPGREYVIVDESANQSINGLSFSPGVVFKGTSYTSWGNPVLSSTSRITIQSDGANWIITSQPK
jgi:hypothetical protein